MAVVGAPGTTAPAGKSAGKTAATHPAASPIISLATTLANIAQLPQIQAIREAQAQADAQARAQQASLAGYTHALAPILAQIAPAVQQGYTQAAGLDALLGKGFGNELGQSQQAAQDQSAGILQNAGAPAGQQAAVSQAIGGSGVQNALGFLHGGLPAQGLNQAGAAFGAAALMLPGEFAQSGQQQLGQLIGKQNLADQGFTQKLSDVAAQLPGLILKNENTLATQAEKVREFNVTAKQKAAAQAFLNWYHTATVQQRKDDLAAQTARFYANLGETTRHHQATEATAATNAGLSTSRTAATWTRANGYKSDASGNPVLSKSGQLQPIGGYTLAPGGKSVIKTGTSRSSGFSPSQAKGLAQQIKDWHNGIVGSSAGTPVVDPNAKLTYTNAYQRAIAQAPDTPQGQTKAAELVNAEYYGIASANPNIVALYIAQGDKNRGVGLTDSITEYLRQVAAGGTMIGPDVAANAIAKAYRQPLAAVKATMQQVTQLIQSGQVSG